MRSIKNFTEFIKEDNYSSSYIDQENNLKLSKEEVDFDSFPKSVLHTLDNEYFGYDNFDWNSKVDEYTINGVYDSVGFNEWLKKNKSEMFLKNLSKLIRNTNHDLIILKKQEIASKKLKAFEELIKPALGSSVLSKALSRFEELVIMNPNATVQSIEAGFREAKNIIDKDGSINQLKITPSNLFDGGDINIPAFEDFVKKNPEFRGVYNDWLKLYNEDMKLSLTRLNAFRDTTPYAKIKELRDFLIEYRKNITSRD